MPEKLCLAHSDQSNLLLKVLILIKVKPMNNRSQMKLIEFFWLLFGNSVMHNLINID